jgi:hypothetical protein
MRSFGKVLFIFLTLLCVYETSAQESKWKRRIVPNKLKTQLFHSTQSINLPTSETLQKGDLFFEISHRFIPTIKSGSKELWGFDGPANIRLALGYAFSDNSILTLGRSNLDNNFDLSFKHFLFESKIFSLPLTSSLLIGGSWNSDVNYSYENDFDLFQFYGQLIFNTMIEKKLGIGLVPSYLYNSHVQCKTTEYSFTLGSYMQFYFNDMYSFIVEWNPTVTGWRQDYNPVSFGFEIETGGHFFKIILTNSSDLNASQFLAGADKKFSDGDLRFGFNIIRIL